MANQVAVKFTADVNEAIKKIAGFSEQSTASLKQVESSVGLLANAGKLLAGAFVFEKVASGFVDIVKKSAEAETAFEGMKSALKTSGDFSANAANQFVKLADRLQKTTVFDDDVILGQVAIAKSFQTTNWEAAKLIEAAVELSAATGTTLDNAVNQLGKTLDGTAGKLAETVPGLRRFSEEQLRAGAALDYVKTRFAGAAEAQTNTFNGALKQTENSFSNVLETLGDFITKNDNVIEGLKKLTEFFERLVTDNGLQTLIGSITGAVVALGGLLATFTVVTIAIKTATAAAALFGTTMGIALGPVGAIALAVTALGAALGYMATKQTEVKSASEIMNEELNKAQESVDNLQAAIKRNTDKDYGRILERNLAKAEEKLIEIQTQMHKAQVHSAMAGQSAKSIGDGFNDAGKKARRFSEEIKNQVTAVLKRVSEIGLTDEQSALKKYQDQIAVIEKARRNGQIETRDYLYSYYKLNKELEDEIQKARLKNIEEQAERFKKFFAEPVRYFTDKTATAKDQLAAGLGAFSQLLSGGSRASADARRDYEDNRSSLGEQFGQANADAQTEFDRDKADIEKRLAARVIDERQAQEELTKAQDEFEKKRAEIQAKYNRDSIRAEAEYQKNLKEAKKQEISSAAKVIGSGLATAADAFIPGLGQAVGPIFEALAQGPEAVTELVQSFVRAIPDLIVNVVQAIPAVITALIDEIPNFITALAEAAPTIIETLVTSAPAIIVKLVEKAPEVIMRMVAAVPLIIGRLLEGVPQFIGKLVEGAARFIGAILEGAVQFAGAILTGAFSFVSAIGEGAVNFVGRLIEGAGDFIKKIIELLPGGGFLTGSGNGGLLGGNIIPGILKAMQSESSVNGLTSTVPGVGRAAEMQALGEATGYGLHGRYRDQQILRELAVQEGRISNKTESSGTRSDVYAGSSNGTVSTIEDGRLEVVLKIGESELARVLTNISRRGFRTA